MHTDFTIEHPRTLSEAVEILGTDDPLVRPLAGGTGITVLMKYDFMRPSILVNLRHVAAEASSITPGTAGGFRIGAMATLHTLERSTELVGAYPILGQALRVLASARVRNAAQLGGALAHANPQMDLPPVLLALGARVLARSRRGERWIELDDLLLGYYETALRSDELIVAVDLPDPGHHRGVYRKFTERTVDDWPMLGVAAVATNGPHRRLRVVLGALSDRPLLLPRLESAYESGSLDRRSARDVVREVADGIDYRDRPFASASYQRQLVTVHVARVLEELLAEESVG